MKYTKLLITGASGWLGYQFIQNCIKGTDGIPSLFNQPNLKLICFISKTDDPKRLIDLSDRVHVVQGDIRDANDCASFLSTADSDSVIVHIAGVIHPNCVKEFYEINTKGTQTLLALSLQKKVKRFVYISSNSPIGCNPSPDHRFDENSPYNPYMHYGRSKMLAELAVQKANQEGLDTVTIRPPWFYGPNQPARQTLFFKLIQEGKFPIVGNGENMRSMGYVDNLCQGIYLATVSEKATGKTFWIADEKAYSMNEIVETVRTALQESGFTVQKQKIRLPNVVGEIAFFIDKTLQSVGIYHQKFHVLSEMNKSIACSVENAKNDLGYSPKITLKEGMLRSIRWCKENNLI